MHAVLYEFSSVVSSSLWYSHTQTPIMQALQLNDPIVRAPDWIASDRVRLLQRVFVVWFMEVKDTAMKKCIFMTWRVLSCPYVEALLVIKRPRVA